MPFSSEASPAEFKMSVWQSPEEVVCHRGDDTRLTGFDVASNDSAYVHSEEMFDFGGTVALHQAGRNTYLVSNGTTHPLESCRVVRGGEFGNVQIDESIGRIEPGAAAKLNFKNHSSKPAAEMVRHSAEPSGELSAEGLARIALRDRTCGRARSAWWPAWPTKCRP